MSRYGSTAGDVAAATFAGGPIFVASTGAAMLYLQLPNPIVVTPADVIGFIVTLPLALFGAVLAGPIAVAGTALMIRLANRWPTARSPLVWALAGGMLPYAFLRALDWADDLPAMSFALVATGAVCG